MNRLCTFVLLATLANPAMSKPVGISINVSGRVLPADPTIEQLDQAGFRGLSFGDDDPDPDLGAICHEGDQPIFCATGEQVPVMWHDGTPYILHEQYLDAVAKQVTP